MYTYCIQNTQLTLQVGPSSFNTGIVRNVTTKIRHTWIIGMKLLHQLQLLLIRHFPKLKWLIIARTGVEDANHMSPNCKLYTRSGYHFTFCGVFRPVFIGQWVCKRFRALPLKYFLKNWESYDLLPESETGNSTAVEQVEGWNLEKGPSIIQHLCKESI